MRSRKINKCKHFDPACRNNGGDPCATSSRLHSARKRIEAASVEDFDLDDELLSRIAPTEEEPWAL